MLTLSLIVVGVGVYSLCMSSGHLLGLFLSLEYSSLGVFLLLVIMMSGEFIYLVLCFLIFLVSEGAVGLSVLVAMSRSHGSGFLHSLQWGFSN